MKSEIAKIMKSTSLLIIIFFITSTLSAQYGVKWMAEPNFDFDYVQEFNDSTYFTLVEKNDKYGLVDMYGKAVLPIIYDDIDIVNKRTWIVELNEKYGLWTKDIGNPNCIYDEMDGMKNGYYTVSVDEKIGLIDKNGVLIIPIQYNYISWGSAFQNYYNDNVSNEILPYFFAITKENQYVIFSADGTQVTPINEYYKSILIDTENEIFVGLNSNNNLHIIKNQKIIKKFPVKELLGLSDSIILFKNEEEKAGAITVNGDIIIKPNFDDLIFGMYKDGEVFKNNSLLIGITKVEDTTAYNDNGVMETTEAVEESTETIEEVEEYPEKDNKVYFPVYTFFNKSGVKLSDTSFTNIFFTDSEMIFVINSDLKYQGLIDINENLQSSDILKESNYTKIEYYSIDDMNREHFFYPKLIEFFKENRYRLHEESENRMIISNNDDKWGHVDFEGNIVTELIYEHIYPFKNGYAKVKRNGKYGLINHDGQLVFNTVFDGINISKQNLVHVYQNNSEGVYRLDGQVVLNPYYDYISFSNENNLFTVKKGDYKGVYSLNGDEILSCIYDYINYHNQNNFFVVEKNELYGMYSVTGQLIAPAIYESIYVTTSYTDEITINATKNGIDGYLTFSGRFFTIRSDKYASREKFCFDRVRFKQNNKYGFCDRNGRVVIPAIYEQTAQFHKSGYAQIIENGKYGLINQNGEVVVPTIYDRVGFFEGKAAIVKKDGKYGLVDRSGNVVVPLYFDDIKESTEQIIWMKVNGKWGIAINSWR